MKSVRVLATAPLLLALGAVGPAVASHSPSTQATAVKVVMTDYGFTLSRQRLVHGKVIFRVVNAGEVVHDFKIAGKKTPYYENRESGALSVLLAKPGKYSFVCTLPGHIAAGMKGTLTVR